MKHAKQPPFLSVATDSHGPAYSESRSSDHDEGWCPSKARCSAEPSCVARVVPDGVPLQALGSRVGCASTTPVLKKLCTVTLPPAKTLPTLFEPRLVPTVSQLKMESQLVETWCHAGIVGQERWYVIAWASSDSVWLLARHEQDDCQPS